MSNARPFYASYIDGLRAIAVLSVIIYHLNSSWLPGGFAGVDIFFVISGFVVSSSVSSLNGVSLPALMLHFYSRRLVRIAPALVVCLLVTFLATALLIPAAYMSNANQETGLFAFLGLSNFILAKNVGSYFAVLAEYNPFTHTWSLAVEEQFYLAFPFLFFAWLRMRRSLSITLFSICVVASLWYAIWVGPSEGARSFYMIWGRFWELGSGVLLFQLMHAAGHSFTQRSANRPTLVLGSLIFLAMLVAGLLSARPESAPFPACVLPVFAAVGLIGCLHGRSAGPVHWLLTRTVVRFVGRASYSLYLWHWPVFVLFKWTVGLESPICQLTGLAITAVLSIASYYWIETPPRKAAKRVRKIGLIACGVALAASGYAVSSEIAAKQAAISLSTVQRHADQWYPTPFFAAQEHPTCVPTAPMTDVNGGALWIFNRTQCADKVTFPHRVFVIGDSHAMMYLPLFGRFVMDTGAQVYAYSNGGCPFINLLPGGSKNPNCERYTDAAVRNMLPQIRPGDVLFLASLRLPRMIDQATLVDTKENVRKAVYGGDGIQGRSDGEKDAIPVLREIAARGARIVFEGPTPMLETVPYRCSDWFNRHNPICKRGDSVSKSFLEDLRLPALQSYELIGAKVPGVTVWDPFPLLCPKEPCTAALEGSPLFFDGDHLSGFANRLLLPSFEKFMLDTQNASP